MRVFDVVSNPQFLSFEVFKSKNWISSSLLKRNIEIKEPQVNGIGYFKN
jgi:hypothetical protein